MLLWSKFQNPPKTARPMARWWWPGLDVSKEELLREVAEMDEQGLAGGEVQAFVEIRGRELTEHENATMHRYRTPYYFDVITAVLEECQKRGMILDLTSCSGWPTNSVDLPADQRQPDLYAKAILVPTGTKALPLPDANEVIDAYFATKEPPARAMFAVLPPDAATRAGMRLLAVTAARCLGTPGELRADNVQQAQYDAESVLVLTDHVRNGVLYWTPPDDGIWQAFVYYTGPSGVTCHNASREDPSKPAWVVDHFGKGIMEPYLDKHIGEGNWDQYFGNTLRGFFTDSFELTNPWLWGNGLLEEFKKRRGYDLTPYLMTTFVSGTGFLSSAPVLPCFDLAVEGRIHHGDRVRHDYQQTLSDMFNDYFLSAMKQWGEARGLKSRVQCYGHPMDNITAFGNTHIPETEQLADGGTIDFMKLAGSSALLYQQPLATAESLVWINRDYMTTPMKMKVASDRLFISGINQMIYHGWPYRKPGVEYPGYYPFHGSFATFMARENPLFEYMPLINEYITRGQYLMQSGPAMIDVAVYNQNMHQSFRPGRAEELSTGILDGIDREDPVGAGMPGMMGGEPRTRWERMTVYGMELGQQLMEAGYDYAHLNRERLLSGKLDQSSFKVGDASFKVILVPNADQLHLDAAMTFKRLLDAGFPVIFIDQLPVRVPGLANYEEQETELKLLLASCSVISRDTLIEVLQGIVPPGLQTEAKGVQHIRRSLSGQTLYFVRSRLPESRSITFTLPISTNARLLNCWNGKTGTLPMTPKGNGMEITLPFGPYMSYFLLFGGDLPEADDEGYLPVMEMALRNDGIAVENWHLKGYSALPGDDAAITMAVPTLKDWADMPEMKHFSGQAVYTGTFKLKKEGSTFLDLGMVGDVAEVEVNGVAQPTLVAYPYILDISDHVMKGENKVTVMVTNTLRNGLVGKDAFKNGMFGGGGARQLATSGLIGPVMVRQ